MSFYVLNMCQAIIGMVVGLVRGYQVALVLIGAAPFLTLVSSLRSKMRTGGSEGIEAAYANAGSVSEEVLGSIKTVTAFGTQRYHAHLHDDKCPTIFGRRRVSVVFRLDRSLRRREIDRYEVHLRTAKRYGVIKSTLDGFSVGSVWLAMFCTYAVRFHSSTPVFTRLPLFGLAQSTRYFTDSVSYCTDRHVVRRLAYPKQNHQSVQWYTFRAV